MPRFASQVRPRRLGGGGDDGAGRAYPWLAGGVAAVLLVAWGASVAQNGVESGERALAAAALFSGSCVLAVLPGVAVVSVAARRIRLTPATGLGLLFAGAGAAGMAGFWAWFFSPDLGRVFAGILLAASLVAIGVFGRRGDMGRLGLSQPLALALAVGLVFTGFAFIQGGLTSDPLHVIYERYWDTRDSTFPLVFAQKVAGHQRLSGFMIGTWLSSDRPPLQTGFVLLQWPLWGANQNIPYQLLSTGLQVSWLPALWTVLRVRGVSARRTCIAVLATAATGAVFVNTVYVWPKMLACSLALAALAIVVSREKADRRAWAWVLAVALAALSMLSHGGTAFALLALAPWAWLMLRSRFTVRFIVRFGAACVAAVLVLYVPWSLYQRFVDPPGNRLLKWQLGGQGAITSTGALQVIIQQYLKLSPGHLLANKWYSVRALVGFASLWHVQGEHAVWTHSFRGFARISQLNDLLPAAGPLLLGVLVLLTPSGRRALASVKPLAVFTGLGVVVWVVLEWGGATVPTIIVEGSYAVLVVYIAVCALAVLAMPRPLAVIVGVACLAWCAMLWFPGLGFYPVAPGAPVAPVDHAMLALLVVGLAAVAVICAAWVFPRRAASDTPGGDPAESDSSPESDALATA